MRRCRLYHSSSPRLMRLSFSIKCQFTWLGVQGSIPRPLPYVVRRPLADDVPDRAVILMRRELNVIYARNLARVCRDVSMMRADGNHWPIIRHPTAPINALKDRRPPKARPVSSLHAPLNSIDQTDQTNTVRRTVIVMVMNFTPFMFHALPFDLLRTSSTYE